MVETVASIISTYQPPLRTLENGWYLEAFLAPLVGFVLHGAQVGGNFSTLLLRLRLVLLLMLALWALLLRSVTWGVVGAEVAWVVRVGEVLRWIDRCAQLWDREFDRRSQRCAQVTTCLERLGERAAARSNPVWWLVLTHGTELVSEV